ncbi:MAG: putative lipoprotein [Frankiales bacterium]|nr:putative lipoprotein [Frankiales bacterium]
MIPMLTDDDLTRLLGEAAEAFDVPDEGPGFVLEELADAIPARPWLRRRGVQLTAAAAAIAVAAVLAQNVGSSSHRTQQAAAAVKRLALPAIPRDSATTGGRGLAGAAAPGLAPASVGGLAGSSASTTGTGATVIDGGDSRVVKTGTVTLLADRGKVSSVVSSVQRLVVAPAYISNQSSQQIGENPSATLTMRVPVGSFEAVETAVQKLGAKVVSVQSSGKDVTATYADTAAQIASLKAARSRFLTILAGARTIGETLTVQQRVDDVQGQIDRLEGQRRLLQNQSDLATLTVTVSEKAPAVGKASSPNGLSTAWDRATHGFTSGVEGLIARSGRALLVVMLVALGFVVLRLGWRLARRRLV